MIKSNERKAQYTMGIDAKGMMSYMGTFVPVDPDTEVIKIARPGIVPGYT